ncbi:MAG TPA: hypothetical protein PJ984_04425 [Candidatus Saccharibacteria bacterium]|jgi:hypothetical protein|nr:hypothetical protein [Candidatus Saccharibacteria bacterium]
MEKTHFVNAVGDKLRLVRRAMPALAIGMLVRQVVLQKNNGKRTPLGRGGWRTLDISEFQAPDHEAAKTTVIPFDTLEFPAVPEPRRVIDVADIPLGQPKKPQLTVINKLIDVEDIPAS